MALIKHADSNTNVLVHDGEQYRHHGNGIFEVPEEVAQALTSFTHWNRYYGEQPYVVTSASSESETKKRGRGEKEAKDTSDDQSPVDTSKASGDTPDSKAS
jgi:hypothetical protein